MLEYQNVELNKYGGAFPMEILAESSDYISEYQRRCDDVLVRLLERRDVSAELDDFFRKWGMLLSAVVKDALRYSRYVCTYVILLPTSWREALEDTYLISQAKEQSINSQTVESANAAGSPTGPLIVSSHVPATPTSGSTTRSRFTSV